MCEHTPFKKSCECETTTRHFLYEAKWFSNHTQASKSKWFVGSSSNKIVGVANNAFANDTRIRHPPDISFVGR